MAGPSVRVVHAVYGALDGSQVPRARDVTHVLQTLLEKSSVVEINNANMGGDPAIGVVKHFGAIVDVGDPLPWRLEFACQEGQTIDFAATGGTIVKIWPK